MAVMNSADVLKINNSEQIVGVISEVIQSVPELGYFQASPVQKNTYKTLCVTGAPTVAFRPTGTERTFSTATLNNKTITLKYLDASWIVEKAVATQSDWGTETCLAIQQAEHLKAAFFKLATQIWTGKYENGVDEGFDGFYDVIKTANVAYINANTGTALSDGSKVFMVRTGLDSAQIAWGNEGKLIEGDILEQLLTTTTSSGKTGAWYFAQELAGWCGLQLTSKYCGGCIDNLSATGDNNGLTDNLLYELYSKFPIGAQPTAICMNRRSLAKLRKSRTATNATGQPAPYPSEWEGLPIYVTDAIGNTDTQAS